MRHSPILICIAFLLGSAGCRSPVVDVDVSALHAQASALDQDLVDVDNPAPEERRFREAGELRKQILDYDWATLDANSLVLADAMDHLAWDYINDAMLSKGMLHQIDRPNALYAEATKLLQNALAIDEHADPPDNEQVANVSFHLALGPVSAAERQRLIARAVVIYEKRLGPNAPVIADVLLTSLGGYEQRVTHYHEIEAVLKRVVSIRALAYGPDDRRVADALERLGYFYFTNLDRYDLADEVEQRALSIYEKTLDPNAPKIAALLLSLGENYQAQHRLSEAESLYKRAAAIFEKALGPDDLYVAITLNGLAQVYRDESLYEPAKDTFRRALEIFRKVYPQNDATTISYTSQIADIDRLEGDLADADALRDQVRDFARRHGLDADDVGFTALDLAERRFDIVEKVERKKLAALDVQAQPFDPGGMYVHDLLARALDGEGRAAEALAESRKAVAIATERAARDAGQRSVGAINERRSRRGIVAHYIDFAQRLACEPRAECQSLTDGTFQAAQLAEASSTEEAVAAMAVRLASSDSAMAKLIRDRDDAQLERQRIEASLTNALGAGAHDAAAEDAIRQDLAAADARLSALDAALRQGYPQYAEIANPLAVSIAEAQKLLTPDEALMTYFISDSASFLWVVRPDRSALIRLLIGREDLLSDVAFLRRGLDPTGRTIRTRNDIPRFDIAGAFDLYGKIFAPAMPLLDGVKSILVVPDGALQSLPLAVLVTERPAGPASSLTAYRSVPWLARRFAITVLPAVSSLRALRVFAQAAHPRAPFAGFGDPLFDGNAAGPRGVETTKIMRGAEVDLTELRKLPRLADTAGELREEARALNAPDSAVHLGGDATVGEVKHADLADTRIIAFATHGLVAGDLPLLAEPALALTPPQVLTQEDSGLLKASDVTQLKLNADWVVLSACNTAASDGSEGAEGLSGLAKAFFYAGARAVLVSHWPVNSRAAVKLTTGTFDALAREPAIGRAEALRRAMLAMINATGGEAGFEFQSHPMFWAPFVIVGEGGAGR